jgi:hypothetical protein
LIPESEDGLMKREDLMKCPLLQGLDAMHRAELLGLINDSGLKEKLEQCLSQHATGERVAIASAAGTKADEFEQDVHKWDTKAPLWRRSEKE